MELAIIGGIYVSQTHRVTIKYFVNKFIFIGIKFYYSFWKDVKH